MLEREGARGGSTGQKQRLLAGVARREEEAGKLLYGRKPCQESLDTVPSLISPPAEEFREWERIFRPQLAIEWGRFGTVSVQPGKSPSVPV